MTQDEQYQQTIIKLHKKVEALKKENRSAWMPDTLEDKGLKKFFCAWGLLEELGKKYVRCFKCNSETKPVSYNSGFMSMICIKCDTKVDVEYTPKKNKRNLNAYGKLK